MTSVEVTDRGLRAELIRHGVLVPMGVAGLYGKGNSFLDVFEGLDRYLTDAGRDSGAERLRFPPLLPREDLVRTDYLRAFPDLVGAIHSFSGGDREHLDFLDAVEHGRNWSAGFDATDMVLLPAACYPLYPMVAGALPPGGRTFDVLGLCFRHEPSPDPARMQSFHQREYVHLGSPSAAAAFRDRWLDRAVDRLGNVGLHVAVEVANDPFFGRAGKMLAANQRAAELKYEVVATVANADAPTAIASGNCHQDHLTAAFGITAHDGSVAHSACIGFGMERITLALFAEHGPDPAAWPGAVRQALWP